MLDTSKNVARLATHTRTHAHTPWFTSSKLKSPVKKLLLAASATTLFSLSAQAADGCKFLLCMGAPNPMGIAECAPTVKEVLRDLSKGRGLPTCKLESGLDSKTSGSYVTYARASYTPRCPKGYAQGSDGVFYHQGTRPEGRGFNFRVSGGSQNIRITNDEGLWRGRRGEYSQRVCVSGNNNGSHTWYSGSRYRKDSDYRRETHTWYDLVSVMRPDGATYEFTLHVDNAPYSMHRF